MKRSTIVTLVLSGAMVAGCDNRPRYPSGGYTSSWDGQSGTNGGSITNNTYRSGYGYWHAPFRGWYPYPYNYYRPGFGYFAGGGYRPSPFVSPIFISSPYGWGGGSHGGGYAGYGGSGGTFHSVGVTRGGFGSSGHASS